MTNNDDFDQPDYNPTEGLPPPKGARANLAEAWRSRPLFKLVVLMTAVAAVVAAGVSFFGGSSAMKNTSRLPTPPSISSAPGGPTSPYMASETDLANRNREQQALATGGSAMPTPIGQSADMSALSNDTKKNDPLNELKAEIERLRVDQKQTQQQQAQQQQIIQQQQQAPARAQQQEQFDDSLATAMQHQMAQLMESWTPQGVKEVIVTKAEDLKAMNAKASDAAAAAAKSTAAANTPPPKTLVSAGTVSYAQLLTEANSDVPGPILAQIVSGPFSGARAVGNFQVANGYADYLVLQFTLVNFKGKDYPISAIALDPDTTLGGMATEVDQRYLTRVVLPAAAGFLQGFGQALGTGNSTTTTNGTSTIISQGKEGYRQGLYQGLGQGATTMSQFFQNQANQTKPLVRVAAGTPMGMFFISSVQDQTVQELQQQQQALNPYGAGLNSPYQAASPFGSAGASPYGMAGVNPYAVGAYPGTNVAGYGSSTQSNVPYPNYGNPAATTISPYSALPAPTTGVGNVYYSH